MMSKGEKYAITAESNPEAMKVVYSKGWAASPEYMTIAEAAAITDEVFKQTGNNWGLVTHFDEWRYFTGLTNSGYFSFNLAPIEKITIPASIRTMASYTVRSKVPLRVIVLPTTPPTCKGLTFNPVWNVNFLNAKFYVPDASYELYKAAQYWSERDINKLSDLHE